MSAVGDATSPNGVHLESLGPLTWSSVSQACGVELPLDLGIGNAIQDSGSSETLPNLISPGLTPDLFLLNIAR